MEKSTPLAPINFIQFIGDKSGSMISQGNSPQIGAQKFLEKWQSISINNKVYLTFITFSNNMQINFNDNAKNLTPRKINDCKNAMKPNGSTRLYDTVIHALNQQLENVNKIYDKLSYYEKKIIDKDNIGKITIICTDGYDNMSIKNKIDMIKVIQKYKKNGGIILFAGANIDVIKEGESNGISSNNCLQIDPNNHTYTNNAYNILTEVSLRMSSSTSTDRLSFTQLERNSSCPQLNQPYNFSLPPPPLIRINHPLS